MSTLNHCLSQLAKVQEVVKNIDSAYLFRSRLRRLILSCNRFIAKECGLQEPNLPTCLALSNDVPPRLKNIAVHCAKLLDLTSTMCQPSEPLDERWRLMWGSLVGELTTLSQLLVNQQNNTSD